MSFSLGEFFINLGIKSTDKTKDALKGVNDGLADVKGNALAAKAGLLATVYAFERLTSWAGDKAMGFKQFAATTGLSAQELQKWQYVAKDMGVSAEDVAGSIKNIQGSMTSMLMGEGAPKFLSFISQFSGGIDMSRARDTFYILEKTRQAIQNMPPDLGKKVAASMGLSEGFFAVLRTHKGDISKIKSGIVMTDSEIAANSRMAAAWDRLWERFRMFSARATFPMASDFVKALTRAMSVVEGLYKSFVKLNKEMPALANSLKAIGIALTAYFAPLTATILGAIYLLSEWDKYSKGEESLFKGSLLGSEERDKKFRETMKQNPGERDVGTTLFKAFEHFNNKGLFTPPNLKNPVAPVFNNTNIINQKNEGVKDTQEVGRAAERGANRGMIAAMTQFRSFSTVVT